MKKFCLDLLHFVYMQVHPFLYQQRMPTPGSRRLLPSTLMECIQDSLHPYVARFPRNHPLPEGSTAEANAEDASDLENHDERRTRTAAVLKAAQEGQGKFVQVLKL